MEEQVIALFHTYPSIAFLISIAINIGISILGVVPSVFLTAANLAVFGFWKGTFLSFVGEAVGAIVSFLLYRKGFRKLSETKWFSYPKVKRLLAAEGKEAFLLVLSLRLLPFVPSGIVTFVAAIGRISLLLFTAASSLGKLPALLLEAYSVYQVMNWTWQGKVISTVFAVFLFIFTWKKVVQNKT
ncbi:putative membrane protein [Anoxybacillus flavithermus TNO-09.006]|uniref:TVP38/TMEM64 family membrane protein n=1 Tax=Anoxybacillus flavithermus TaxID=33934 RepID=A0A178T5S4_9BACL|nr:VTT domain-containing protein [Anoxybacillus flavithermus]ELK22135.1 putative membrane protein [Anoxybacillus flavithermus TNO-09.006]MBE2908871.1 VTT domain-containing protein [Anoxybacillus flavithermus]MBE2911615.1 VTT domain-containing protein [Anoxybacillus flavithermus]MBE2914270.1 VTT domain-containing protein [Anoxybacillus flavithermus]MBE2916930.1 VTT domain-containing protein [Anoxybacillus flavithermus]